MDWQESEQMHMYKMLSQNSATVFLFHKCSTLVLKACYSLPDKQQCNYTIIVMMIITNYIPLEDRIISGYNIKKALKNRRM
jgi:hypothetical protein